MLLSVRIVFSILSGGRTDGRLLLKITSPTKLIFREIQDGGPGAKLPGKAEGFGKPQAPRW